MERCDEYEELGGLVDEGAFLYDELWKESGSVRRFAGGGTAGCEGRFWDRREALAMEDPPIASLLAQPSMIAFMRLLESTRFAVVVREELGSGSFLAIFEEKSRLTVARPDITCLDVSLILKSCYCPA